MIYGEILKIIHFYHFNSNPRFPPFLLYVWWKSGVTFVRRCFRDAVITDKASDNVDNEVWNIMSRIKENLHSMFLTRFDPNRRLEYLVQKEAASTKVLTKLHAGGSAT